MTPDAVGQPIHNAAYDGTLRPGEAVMVEHVPSGRRLVVKLGYDSNVREAKSGLPLFGCVIVVAGPVTPAPSPTEA